MTRDTMLEKIARAIANELRYSDWTSCIPAARAAVQTMNEPTVEMLEAALPDVPGYGFLSEDWHAMVKQILEEYPSGESPYCEDESED